MRQYNQQRSVTTALSQLELDDMEIHLWTELSRQNKEAQETKTNCYETVQRIIQGVEKVCIVFHKNPNLIFVIKCCILSYHVV